MIRIKLQRSHAAELALHYETLMKLAASKTALQDNAMFMLLALHTAEMLELLDTRRSIGKADVIMIPLPYTAALAFTASWEKIDTSKLPLLTAIVCNVIAQIDRHRSEMLTKIFGQPF